LPDPGQRYTVARHDSHAGCQYALHVHAVSKVEQRRTISGLQAEPDIQLVCRVRSAFKRPTVLEAWFHRRNAEVSGFSSRQDARAAWRIHARAPQDMRFRRDQRLRSGTFQPRAKMDDARKPPAGRRHVEYHFVRTTGETDETLRAHVSDPAQVEAVVGE